MDNTLRVSGILLLVIAIIGLFAGLAVMGLALSKQIWMQDAMRDESVNMSSLGVKGYGADALIDNGEKAQVAADTVKSHRHGIAASYSTLLAGGKYDPTNPNHLSVEA